MNNAEFARRMLLRTLAVHSTAFTLTDNDPQDLEGGNRGKVFVNKDLTEQTLGTIGLTNQQQVELFRAELRTCLPLIDGELTTIKLSPGTNFKALYDFIVAALDLKR